MIWLSGIICFAIGIIIGAALFRQFGPDAVKVKKLEKELEAVNQEFKAYKKSVHTHFNSTAELFHQLTDSYRDFYNHLATGARSLCPDSVYNQLTLAEDNHDILTDDRDNDEDQVETEDMFTPPRDYATKSRPDQKGSLSEDFGLRDEGDYSENNREDDK